MLTPWQKEIEMLEDWPKNPGPVDDCREKTVIYMLVEEQSEESLKNFSHRVEQMMMTVTLRHTTTDEGKFQSEEQLELNQHKRKWQRQSCQKGKLRRDLVIRL
jgi:hypothetical protein